MYNKETVKNAVIYAKKHAEKMENAWKEYFEKENEMTDICKDCEYKKLYDYQNLNDLDEIEY